MTTQLQHVRAYGIADTSVVVCQNVPSVEGLRIIDRISPVMLQSLVDDAFTVHMRREDVIITDKGAVYWKGDQK